MDNGVEYQIPINYGLAIDNIFKYFVSNLDSLNINYSPLQASHVKDPSAYKRKSDQSPHSSQ
jgi:hypothetical protein